MYCSTSSACQEIADFRRGLEWTEAARRCHGNGSILPSSGYCRIHKACILWRHGDWSEAEDEARSGCDAVRDVDCYHAALAMEEIGEVRLRNGDLQGAEEAFERGRSWVAPPSPAWSSSAWSRANRTQR